MKTFSLSIFICLIGFFTYKDTVLLIPPKKSSVNFKKSYIEHSSDKCDVYKLPVVTPDRIDGNVYVIVFKKNKMDFKVTNCNEKSNDFYINSNFFSDRPIGEVKIDGKIINKKIKHGGFFTSNGKSPKIYFGGRPGSIKYSSQTHLVGIKNGIINNKVCTQKWSKLKTYRILIGKDQKNNVIVVHSDDGGYLSIKEICTIGVKYGVINGLLFDGGSSVDVGLKDGFYYHTFQSVSTISKKFVGIHKPYTYIIGNFN